MDNTSVRHTAHLGFEQHDISAWVGTGRIRLKINDLIEIQMGECDCEDFISVLSAALADRER